MPITAGLGVSSSTAEAANSGGPFTNNSEIVFGEGIFGATEQTGTQTAVPTATATSDPFAGNANPYAANAAAAPAAGGSSVSTLLIAGAIGLIALGAIWYFTRKK